MTGSLGALLARVRDATLYQRCKKGGTGNVPVVSRSSLTASRNKLVVGDGCRKHWRSTIHRRLMSNLRLLAVISGQIFLFSICNGIW